jgi:UDP:flavonoid glycosyltransferase YjiC (YdhE family)
VPQSLLFPRCDVVVTHGGSGTVLAALAHGLPLLVLPQGANQFWNADRCVELGVGLRLAAGDVSPDAIRDRVETLLGVRAFRDAAVGMAAEIAAMPGPDEAVGLLEALAATGPPCHTGR